MKTFNLFFFFLLIAFPVLNAQSKELEKAVANKADNGVYYAAFKVPQNESKITSWCQKNDFVIIGKKEGAINKFRDIIVGIIEVQFMKKSDYLAMKEQERLAEEERRKKDEAMGNALKFGLVAVLAGGIWYLTSKGEKKPTTYEPDGGNYSFSRTTPYGFTDNNYYNFKPNQLRPAEKYADFDVFSPSQDYMVLDNVNLKIIPDYGSFVIKIGDDSARDHGRQDPLTYYRYEDGLLYQETRDFEGRVINKFETEPNNPIDSINKAIREAKEDWVYDHFTIKK
ncbi:MAG: hypothetical protein JNJ57_04455 [Saprospiraceae bacterium]|nr:hypothetical protein [Saprospiraceae bacterium]